MFNKETNVVLGTKTILSDQRYYYLILFAVTSFAIALACIINPFYLVLLPVTVQSYTQKSSWLLSVLLLLYFSYAFYMREYGIMFSPVAADDVTEYVRRYLELKDISFYELFNRFVRHPANFEPLWYLLWYFPAKYGVSESVFIFGNYLLATLLLIKICEKANKNISGIQVLFFLFFFSEGAYSSIHLWRQHFALLLTMLGVTYLSNGSVKKGLLVVCMAPFVHLSVIVFCIGCIFFMLCRKKINSRESFFIFTSFIVLFIVCALLIVFPLFLNFIGREAYAIISFGESGGLAEVVKIAGVSAFSLLTILKLKHDRFIGYLIVICIIGLTVSLFFINVPIIVCRINTFILPVFSIMFVLVAYYNLRRGVFAVTVSVIISMKIIFTMASQKGVYKFMWANTMFDFLSGYIKTVFYGPTFIQ